MDKINLFGVILILLGGSILITWIFIGPNFQEESWFEVVQGLATAQVLTVGIGAFLVFIHDEKETESIGNVQLNRVKGGSNV